MDPSDEYDHDLVKKLTRDLRQKRTLAKGEHKIQFWKEIENIYNEIMQTNVSASWLKENFRIKNKSSAVGGKSSRNLDGINTSVLSGRIGKNISIRTQLLDVVDIEYQQVMNLT